ncbi:hypothetical protein [Thioalkalivibrio thiocyanodenitrificans]|nr:hypothetical protein [Thioalkalivibrio thiocyanodenitrificans]
MEQSQAIRHFQVSVNSMVGQGAEPADVAGTPLGIALTTRAHPPRP